MCWGPSSVDTSLIIFEKDDCSSHANAAFVLLCNSAFIKTCRKDFDKHNLNEFIQVVSKNGSKNFVFGQLHFLVSFIEEMMPVIAEEHDFDPINVTWNSFQ